MFPIDVTGYNFKVGTFTSLKRFPVWHCLHEPQIKFFSSLFLFLHALIREFISIFSPNDRFSNILYLKIVSLDALKYYKKDGQYIFFIPDVNDTIKIFLKRNEEGNFVYILKAKSKGECLNGFFMNTIFAVDTCHAYNNINRRVSHGVNFFPLHLTLI